MWLNGTPATLIETGGHVSAVSLEVVDGRITRIYATANPQKLTGLDKPTQLVR